MSGFRQNKAQPDLCPNGGDEEHLPGCEAGLFDRRNILLEFKIKLIKFIKHYMASHPTRPSSSSKWDQYVRLYYEIFFLLVIPMCII